MATSRRSFFGWITGLGSAALAGMMGIPSLRAFLAPLAKRTSTPDWIKLGEVDQFEAGVPARFDFAETVNDAWVETRALRGVWIYTGDGEKFSVYNGRCTHLGCGFAWDTQADPQFHPEENVFHCPCHHAVYKVTGEVIRGPAPRPLDTLETKIEDGVLYAAYRDFRAGIPEKIATS